MMFELRTHTILLIPPQIAYVVLPPVILPVVESTCRNKTSISERKEIDKVDCFSGETVSMLSSTLWV